MAVTGLFAAMALTSPAQASLSTINDVWELDGDPQDSSTVSKDDWETLLGSGTGTNGYKAKTAVPIVDGDSNTSPADASYYKGGGSKDVRDISLWQHSATDVAPDKDEILNAFAAAYLKNTKDGTGFEGDELILTFGSDRFSNGGDAQMGFWFFKNSITLNANGHFNGVHADGDILVLSDFSGGGKISTMNVYKWDNGGLVHLDAGAYSPDCRDDPHNAKVCAVENDNGNVEAEWSYTPKSGPSGKYPTGSFLEGAINISEMVGSSADSCFASFLAETRSSTSPSAQLKDFALARFPICEPTTSMTASPAAASPNVILSGDSQTFTFNETNDGDLELSNAYVDTDSAACDANIAYISGNTDADNPRKLDPGETHVFQCTVSNITADLTITGIGHGTDFRGKDVTYCEPNTTPANTICDAEERALAAVDVIAPSTSMTATAATAAPSTIHANETSTLTFYETNDGTGGTNVQLTLDNPNVTTDNSECGSPAYSAGDTDLDGDLDFGETWAFTCTVTPTSAGTVTVVATGHGTVLGHDVTWCAVAGLNSTQVCDTDEQTTVSVTVINPSTVLTTTASAFVTYSYAEENDAGDGGYLSPPTAGSRASFVTDDNCTPVTYVSGDADNDLRLDDGETWNFTCTKTIAGPTASGGVTTTATGHGIDATGDDVTYCTSTTAGKFCDTDERDSVTVTITHN